MNPIDPSYFIQTEQPRRTPQPDLGKNEFLKILMTQLQHQDPLNPMEDRDFISQMATFSSLEQMMSMSESIEQLVQNQMISPVIQYSQMIGNEVSYEQFNQETGRLEGIETSVVVSVSEQNGWAMFHLENGEKIVADAIVETTLPEKEPVDNEEADVDET